MHKFTSSCNRSIGMAMALSAFNLWQQLSDAIEKVTTMILALVGKSLIRYALRSHALRCHLVRESDAKWKLQQRVRERVEALATTTILSLSLLNYALLKLSVTRRLPHCDAIFAVRAAKSEAAGSYRNASMAKLSRINNLKIYGYQKRVSHKIFTPWLPESNDQQNDLLAVPLPLPFPRVCVCVCEWESALTRMQPGLVMPQLMPLAR